MTTRTRTPSGTSSRTPARALAVVTTLALWAPAVPALAQDAAPAPAPRVAASAATPTVRVDRPVVEHGQALRLVVQGRAGAQVRLLAAAPTAPAPRSIRQAVLSSSAGADPTTGSASWELQPGRTTRFTAVVDGVESSAVTVTVRRAVTVGVRQAARTYTFSGSVAHPEAGVQVTVARLGTDGRVTGVASTRTTAGGRYAIRTSLPTGFASYYALTSSTGDLQAGRSRLYGLVVPGAQRPAAVSPVHGGTYSAVYLVLAQDTDDPRLAAAAASARRLGYTAGTTTLSCDLGAARGLGRPAGDRSATAVLYFRSETAARQFTALHPPVEAGVVRVQTFCLD